MTETERAADLSYHCDQPGFMRTSAIDPSLAAAFYCGTEAEFESLCEHVQRILIDNEKHPLFEVGHGVIPTIRGDGITRMSGCFISQMAI